MSSIRRPAPPPLEANDQLVVVVITAAWVTALAVLLALRTDLPPGSRWWIWTCAVGTCVGLFGLWYVPRLKRSRARLAQRRAEADAADGASPDPSPDRGPGGPASQP